jgi:hypothetical protein
MERANFSIINILAHQPRIPKYPELFSLRINENEKLQVISTAENFLFFLKMKNKTSSEELLDACAYRLKWSGKTTRMTSSGCFCSSFNTLKARR